MRISPRAAFWGLWVPEIGGVVVGGCGPWPSATGPEPAQTCHGATSLAGRLWVTTGVVGFLRPYWVSKAEASEALMTDSYVLCSDDARSPSVTVRVFITYCGDN